MKNHELSTLLAGLQACSEVRGDFAYLVAHNLRLVSAEVGDLEAVKKPTERIEVYERARVALCLEHSEKDGQGNPIVVGNAVNVADPQAMNKDFAALQAEHLEAVKEQAALQSLYDKKMGEEARDLKLLKTTRWDIPKEITAGTIGNLFPMIDQEAKKPATPED